MYSAVVVQRRGDRAWVRHPSRGTLEFGPHCCDATLRKRWAGLSAGDVIVYSVEEGEDGRLKVINVRRKGD